MAEHVGTEGTDTTRMALMGARGKAGDTCSMYASRRAYSHATRKNLAPNARCATQSCWAILHHTRYSANAFPHDTTRA